MSAQPQPRPTLYERLEALPEGLTGEILDGQIYTQPRPSALHVFAAAELNYELLGPFERGRGGPGGWLVDPLAHTLEAYALDAGAWRELGRFAGGARVSVAPFEAVTICLDDLWAPV